MSQMEVVYHRGEQHRIRQNLNLYIVVQQNALLDIEISTIDICLTNIVPNPNTFMFSVLHE